MGLSDVAAISIIGVLIFINFGASWIIFKSEISEPRQKVFQYAIVWFLPLIGAALVYRFSHEPKVSGNGVYPSEPSLGDDPYVGISNSATDYFQDGHHSP